MRPQDRALARRQLDKRLQPQRDTQSLARPPRGWIRAIREALGMTGKQLGQRLGVSQPRIIEIEKAETSGAITLDTLQRAANALDCQLVYCFVPRKPLQDLVEERAQKRARSLYASTAHSMALEAQSVDKDTEETQIDKLVGDLVEKSGPALWKDE